MKRRSCRFLIVAYALSLTVAKKSSFSSLDGNMKYAEIAKKLGILGKHGQNPDKNCPVPLSLLNS